MQSLCTCYRSEPNYLLVEQSRWMNFERFRQLYQERQ